MSPHPEALYRSPDLHGGSVYRPDHGYGSQLLASTPLEHHGPSDLVLTSLVRPKHSLREILEQHVK